MNLPMYGVGILDALVTPLTLDAQILSSLLPPPLELAPQTLTPSGSHPLLLWFGEQREVRPHFSPRPLSLGYRIFHATIPHVRWALSPYPYQGPFTFMPAAYLDRALPALLGHLLGHANRLGRLRDGRTFRVHTRTLDTPVLKAHHTAPGPRMAANTFAPLTQLRPTLEQPTLSQYHLGPYVTSQRTWKLSQAHVTPVEATVTFQSELLEGLAPGTHDLPSLSAHTLGAFRLHAPWMLRGPTWPGSRQLGSTGSNGVNAPA